MFVAVMLVFVFPFTIGNMGNLTHVNWTLVIVAGVLGAIGTLLFNNMLSKATNVNVGSLVVTMVILQIVVSGTYQTFMSGITIKHAIGFALAISAAILLT